MKILAVSDEECPALWDHYMPGRLADYDLILSCGDLKASYLTFLATMSRARVLYVHGNHDDHLNKNFLQIAIHLLNIFQQVLLLEVLDIQLQFLLHFDVKY